MIDGVKILRWQFLPDQFKLMSAELANPALTCLMCDFSFDAGTSE